MANELFSNENAKPQREICLLLLETTEVNPYLGEGMIREEPISPITQPSISTFG